MALAKLLTRSLPAAPFPGDHTQNTSMMPGVAGFAQPVSKQLVATGGRAVSGDGAVLPDGYPPFYMSPASEETVLTLAAAWRCLHILTDGISGLEMYAFDDTHEDRRVSTPRLLSDPWPAISPVEWRAMVVASLVLYGNCYILPYDEDPRTGYPRQLPIVHPDEMRVVIRNGVPYYFMGQTEINRVDVLHIRGYTPPGQAVGIGCIEAFRRGFSLALDMDRYEAGNLQQSSVPPVIIKVNRPEISAEQATDIQYRWMAAHGYGQRTPAVIPTSLDVNTLAWSPEDTQFLQSKQYGAVEICWMFGVDPRLLGLSASGQSLTYANIETTYVDLQRMSFLPWTTRIEATLSRVLPRGVLARFDFAPILRTTLQDRYAAYAVGVQNGWLTIDEVRQAENLGPLGTETPPKTPVLQSEKAVNDSIPMATDTVEVVA